MKNDWKRRRQCRHGASAGVSRLGERKSTVPLAKAAFVGEAVNRPLARITDLIVELFVVKLLMADLEPASGRGILEGMFGGFLANDRRAPVRLTWWVSVNHEVFMPKSAGVVIPNGQLGGGGATQNVVINAPVTVNANGGDPAQNRDLANQMGKAVKGQVRGLVARVRTRLQKPKSLLS